MCWLRLEMEHLRYRHETLQRTPPPTETRGPNDGGLLTKMSVLVVNRVARRGFGT
jgi:hypothetical protein